MISKRAFPFLLAMALSVVCGLLPSSLQANPKAQFRGHTGNFINAMPPVMVPDTPFSDTGNVVHTLAEYRGKVILVNFWATWCQACVVEMPQLDELQRKLGSDVFAVLTISQTGGDKSQTERFLDSRGFGHLPRLTDDDRRLGRSFNQTMLPTSILIDAEGREIGRLIGSADWASPSATKFIRGFIR